jgi:CheY-like chemotaxis protein
VRARSLVQQILAFSRRQPHRLTSQTLRPVIEESVRLLRPVLPALAALDVRLADVPMPVRADATQLQQVVLNLCTNAWHALNGQAGRITVGLDAVTLDAEAAARLGLLPARHAHLWVGDTGCGMDEATRARVFEPFFTTKPIGQGTGLGLSVVHGIVASHGGAISVASQPGKGSRFDVYLPLLAKLDAVVPATSVALQAGSGTDWHVAYVDDDPVMVAMVQALLQRCGYRVTCFDDPLDAVAALRAQPASFDAVVTDYNMPRLSGLDVARTLVQLRPDLPVVISSGYLTDELLAEATQLGVRTVMQKEYTLEQLPGILQGLLSGATVPGT